ncbi:hypothetical protein [Streptomyces sp. MBT62]|uniref:hypothetical protein n=1 Tax=Streptomyces sp. MBT62 TaxID=2800410 RepID=UPI00190BDCD4|nr:hypothetical protein [Streptomyces sp. MBT62]MBK3566922.1 hypothetical protein [Streptomyces sp. MBT62]
MTDQRRSQLETAAVILSLARPMVDDDAPLTADELRWIARRLVESLTDVLGIAAGHHDRTANGGNSGT